MESDRYSPLLETINTGHDFSQEEIGVYCLYTTEESYPAVYRMCCESWGESSRSELCWISPLPLIILHNHVQTLMTGGRVLNSVTDTLPIRPIAGYNARPPPVPDFLEHNPIVVLRRPGEGAPRGGDIENLDNDDPNVHRGFLCR